jgi:hypothetical protein
VSDTLLSFIPVTFLHSQGNSLATPLFHSPVLTKPDLIDKGGERAVKELLLGSKTQAFDCGFHMVKGNCEDISVAYTSLHQCLLTLFTLFSACYFYRTRPGSLGQEAEH